MDVHLQRSKVHPETAVKISGSKSETNRLLLLQALYPEIILENTSNSDDSEAMINALTSKEYVIDIHHAGTAMRFLTAYFALQENREVILTGSKRMKERPITILVDALRQLGADISYTENEGFPPLKINGKKLSGNKVTLDANVSSQYISALLLIASKLEKGLELKLEGEITSIPYIKMTLALLNEIGIKTSFQENVIKVFPKGSDQYSVSSDEDSVFGNHSLTGNQSPTTDHRPLKTVTIESDWSSASYFYSVVALYEPGTQIILSSYKQNSLQGDAVLAEIYTNFGVETVFTEANTIVIRKSKIVTTDYRTLAINLNSAPDIAQTIAVTCFGLGIACHLIGLHTLKIKETDRLEALKIELEKLGADISVTNESLTLGISENFNPNTKIATYNDHRMAMAFAPLALKLPIIIENAEVVSKSYPDFWTDLKSVGFHLS